MTIFTDAATITSTSQLLTVDTSDFVDSDIFSTVTTLTSEEGGPYSDSATLSVVTTIPVGEFDFVHPTGFWGSFDVDDGVL